MTLAAYDFVDLPGADGGLAKALELFWRLKRVTFTPTGTAYVISYEREMGFQAGFTIPDPDPQDADFHGSFIGGMIIGDDGPAGPAGPIAPVPPELRMVPTGPSTTAPGHFYLVDATASYVFGPGTEVGEASDYRVRLRLLRRPSGWQLGYYFEFDNYGLRIRNAAQYALAYDASGVVDLFGLSLSWRGRYDGSVVTPMDLTCSAEGW